MVVDLIQNAALLITLTVFIRILAGLRKKNPLWYKIVSGLWFGLIAVAGMMMPFVYEGKGIIYDGRSIILTLAGLFGGGIPALISSLIASLYRISLGGAGVYAGVSTIILCAATGLFFRRFFQNRPDKINWLQFFGIGVVSHIFMLASQLLIPAPTGLQVVSQIWLSVLLIFPTAFLFMSVLMVSEEQRLINEVKLKNSESLYRTTLYSLGDAVITTDKDGIIQQLNPMSEKLTGWKEEEAIGKSLEQVFNIINEYTREIVENPARKVMESGSVIGLANHTLLISKTGEEIPIADSAAPIKNEHGQIIGTVLVYRDQIEERKQQNLIKESEKKYRKLVESTDAIAWEYDAVGDQWLYISPQVERITGWKPDEWSTLDFWLQRVHPEDKDVVNFHFSDYSNIQKEQVLEYRFMRKDGSYQWFRDVYSIEGDESNLLKFRGYKLDITEHKHSEMLLHEKNREIAAKNEMYKATNEQFRRVNEDLIRTKKEVQESEQRFQRFMDNIPAFVYIKDENLKHIYDNKLYVDTFNLKSEQEKIDTKQVFSKEVLEKIDEADKLVISRKSLYEDLIFQAEVKGRKIWLHDHKFAITIAGGEKAVGGIAFDITDLKESEIQLRKSKERAEQSEHKLRLKNTELHERNAFIQTILDNLPIGIALNNINEGAATYMNKKFEEIYGWSSSDLASINSFFQKVYPDERYRNLLMEKINDDIQSGDASRMQWENIEVTQKDGSKRIVNAANIPLLQQNTMVSTVIDITKLHQIQQELIVAKEKAEESNQLKSAFLQNMSHEIRTPMNAIVGFSGFLKKAELDQTKLQKYAEIIVASSNQLLSIVNDILTISFIETKQEKISLEPANVNEVLANLLIIFKEQAKNKGLALEIKWNLPRTKAEVLTDKTKLTQVMSNLLTNALKFTHEGYVEFGCQFEKEGKELLFFVKDTGIGVRDEHQGQIFERFNQADYSINKKYGGTGLGLSISKAFVEMLGGKIWFDSAFGKGSCFYFTIPYKELD